MDEWRQRLTGIDDDYLIGISNKGIVKRAYKDKEESAAEIVGMGEEAQVKVGDETVTVRFPLGESRCTCPSRSICRHVVQAILTLKESCLQQEKNPAGQGTAGDLTGGQTAMAREAAGESNAGKTAAGQTAMARETAGESDAGKTAAGQTAMTQGAAGESNAKEDTAVQTGIGQDGPGKAAEDRASGQTAGQQQNPIQEQTAAKRTVTEQDAMPQQDSAQERSAAPGQNPMPDTVLKEIGGYPLAKLKKALGNRYFQSLVNQVAAEIRPEIQYSSVVTVRLPEPGITVKLLSPLEYSTCTCHKKELCRHKAAAILWCQLEAGFLKCQDLRKEAAEEPAYDMKEVREAAGQMLNFLEELFDTGLSRVSPDVLDYLERLAIIGHNAGLARFEGYFRALADSYDRYLKRKAAFQTRNLMEQMTRLYRRTQRLLQAEDAMQVGALAGEFRADYLPVGNLDLIGIAAEQYKSQTGYEGETIYFLEENTKKWYTYTNAKPVFYDGARRRSSRESAALQGPAPWGLGISMEKLLKVRIHLTGAKCDGRNRLSSSQETRGEITGEQSLHISDIKNWYYRDFDQLFQERIGKPREKSLKVQGEIAAQENLATQGDSASVKDSAWDTEENAPKLTELVFVFPDSCAKAEFSQTGQQLTLPLYDRAGHELLVEVTYSREEAGTIRYLERISEKKLPCFLGKVSLRDGRLRMYPVDLMDIEALEDAEDSRRQDSALDRKTADREDMPEGKNPMDRQEHTERENPLDGNNVPDSGNEKADIVSNRQSKYNVMEDMAEEILLLMEDLCQSGFETVHDSTLKDMRKAARVTGQYGMQYLSELMGGLADEAEARRHQMKKRIGPMYRLYTDIIEYMNLLRQKTAYDRGADYYG